MYALRLNILPNQFYAVFMPYFRHRNAKGGGGEKGGEGSAVTEANAGKAYCKYGQLLFQQCAQLPSN